MEYIVCSRGDTFCQRIIVCTRKKAKHDLWRYLLCLLWPMQMQSAQNFGILRKLHHVWSLVLNLAVLQACFHEIWIFGLRWKFALEYKARVFCRGQLCNQGWAQSEPLSLMNIFLWFKYFVLICIKKTLILMSAIGISYSSSNYDLMKEDDRLLIDFEFFPKVSTGMAFPGNCLNSLLRIKLF